MLIFFFIQGWGEAWSITNRFVEEVCRVLEPFYDATNQLSNDASCISEVSLNYWKVFSSSIFNNF